MNSSASTSGNGNSTSCTSNSSTPVEYSWGSNYGSNNAMIPPPIINPTKLPRAQGTGPAPVDFCFTPKSISYASLPSSSRGSDCACTGSPVRSISTIGGEVDIEQFDEDFMAFSLDEPALKEGNKTDTMIKFLDPTTLQQDPIVPVQAADKIRKPRHKRAGAEDFNVLPRKRDRGYLPESRYETSANGIQRLKDDLARLDKAVEILFKQKTRKCRDKIHKTIRTKCKEIDSRGHELQQRHNMNMFYNSLSSDIKRMTGKTLSELAVSDPTEIHQVATPNLRRLAEQSTEMTLSPWSGVLLIPFGIAVYMVYRMMFKKSKPLMPMHESDDVSN